jgi:hypothetical protein
MQALAAAKYQVFIFYFSHRQTDTLPRISRTNQSGTKADDPPTVTAPVIMCRPVNRTRANKVDFMVMLSEAIAGDGTAPPETMTVPRVFSVQWSLLPDFSAALRLNI